MLVEKIETELKEALRAKDTDTLSVLRLLKSALQNAEIEKRRELTEEEAINVLEKQAKQRRDSISQYEAGGRDDLASHEKNELVIIERYLPQKMSETDLNSLIETVIVETGATSVADMGKVIKEVMTKAKGTADGSMVSKIVKEKLS